MSLTTPLYDEHLQAGARMVDFGGWDMPLNYGSQVEEHHTVRSQAGLFDVSHMTIVDLEGEQTTQLLQFLLANDIARLNTSGRALYSCMLNEHGGVIDDLISYRFSSDKARVVVNAATREKDLSWITQVAEGYAVSVTERSDTAMIAIQGPQARGCISQAIPKYGADVLAVKRFSAQIFDEMMVARTGYTGEDGFELMLPEAMAPSVWQALVKAGARPCGLGARDTLRLEAGMNLYGQDMDESVSPLECGLGWTVAWEPEDRQFCGRAALAAQQQSGPPRKQIAVVLDERGVLRHGQELFEGGQQVGAVTSGTFSPTLGRAIGLGLVSASAGAALSVDIRGRQLPVRCVRAPFVREGTIQPGVIPDNA